MRHILAAIAALAVLCAACRLEITEDADFHSVDPAGWAYGDTLEFEPELSDSIADAHLAVAVRHSSAYIFENLWLEVSLPPAPGDSVGVTDTVNVRLADPYGRWLGRGSGVTYVCVDTLPGSYRVRRGSPVRIRHIMRVDTVQYLEQIGLIFINGKTR